MCVYTFDRSVVKCVDEKSYLSQCVGGSETFKFNTINRMASFIHANTFLGSQTDTKPHYAPDENLFEINEITAEIFEI